MSDDEQKNIGVDWDLPNERAANWALEYALDLIRNITNTTRRRIAREVSAFITNGETLRALQKRLAPLFGEKRARLIAETETTRAFAEGNMAYFREVGATRRRKQWVTSYDELVCPICGPLHQKIVDLDDEFAPGIMLPHAHPRCRCWIVPVVVFEDENVES